MIELGICQRELVCPKRNLASRRADWLQLALTLLSEDQEQRTVLWAALCKSTFFGRRQTHPTQTAPQQAAIQKT